MAVAAMNPKSAKEECIKKSKSAKCKVAFSDVQVRMYPVTIGSSPGGVSGPPLALSWNYTSLGRATVEDFEKRRNDPSFKRRDLQDLHISAPRRVALLKSAGFSDQQIYEASRQAAQERMERRKSLRQAILKCRALKAEKQKAALVVAVATKQSSDSPEETKQSKPHCSKSKWKNSGN